MESYPEKVERLVREHGLDCYLTFTADCHLNEYIDPEDQRVRKLTGFCGSNGTAITCKDSRLVTDSRYFIQAAHESSYPLFKGKATDYIIDTGLRRVGLDTRLISSTRFLSLQKTLGEKGIEIVEIVEEESIGRPVSELIHLEKVMLSSFINYRCDANNNESSTDGKIIRYLNSLGFYHFDNNVTGSFYADKILRVRELAGDGVVIITELDTIAWVLNTRASDIEYNPVFYAYLVVSRERVLLFTDHSVSLSGVEVDRYANFEKFLPEIRDRQVLVSGDCNYFVYSQFKSIGLTDAVRKAQADKNEIELAGMVLSYVYDGIALTDLFGYMSANDGFTERDIADKLDELKRRLPGYVGPSFETISSTGTNSAIVHHRSTAARVDKDAVFLLDSGSHYYFGTTDTTRTVLFSSTAPSGDRADAVRELVHDNTLVFKGQINAMLTRYGKDMTYADIDRISRSYLKNEGKDFGHATGHGVGHFLCVHEHPPTVFSGSTQSVTSSHVFSVEPGFYREDVYGIRIENLVYSKKTGEQHELVNITMVPYQLSLLEREMLSPEETAFVNAFNERCRWLLRDFVSPEGLLFLDQNTCTVGRE